jgi:methanogenic corrinoid protein MtbC1
MVADQLRSEGWNVVDLGANVPATALAEVAGDCEDLVAVGISMCADEHATRVTDSIEAVRRAKSLVPVLLGGPAVPSLEAARHLGADEWAADSSGVAKIMSRIAGNRR